MVSSTKSAGSSRLECIPILHVRGTHYVVGQSIGRVFKGMIHDLVVSWDYFNNTLWKAYNTEQGKKVYRSCLEHCTNKYPAYVEEIKGMAEGSNVPFEKLFLINIDSVITASEDSKSGSEIHSETGCTSIICNKAEVLLGHTEDAMTEILNNVYVVKAEILDSEDRLVEEFTTFSYAGHLMGYTMGFNPHGMVYSVNTLFPEKINQAGTPRAFIARAILGLKNIDELVEALKDTGAGISDGFSLNAIFVNEVEGNRVYNVEVLPPHDSSVAESQLDILSIRNGETYVHCNKYLRISTPERKKPIEVSTNRLDTVNRFRESTCAEDIAMTLSDQSNENMPIYICDKGCDMLSHVRTVAVGIFDIKKKTWSIYIGKPSESKPTVVFPMEF